MSIIIDVHEDAIYEIKLKQLGIPVEIKALPIGDIWIGAGEKIIVIEHKKINDFFASLMDGRYYKQLYNMMINKQKSMVYITGTYPSYIPMVRGKGGGKYPMDIEKNLRTHKILSYYSYGIPVFQVSSDDEYIKDLIEMYLRSGKQKCTMKPLEMIKKAVSDTDIRINIYGSIPGLGKSAANFLGKKYTIPQIQLLTIKELQELKIGDRKLGKRADKLYAIFNP